MASENKKVDEDTVSVWLPLLEESPVLEGGESHGVMLGRESHGVTLGHRGPYPSAILQRLVKVDFKQEVVKRLVEPLKITLCSLGPDTFTVSFGVDANMNMQIVSGGGNAGFSLTFSCERDIKTLPPAK